MQSKIKTSVRVMGALLGASFLAQPVLADVTGHIDLVSKYVLRGITTTYGTDKNAPLGNKGGDAPESDGPAVQGGVDYTHESGLYAGYWFSTLGYNYKTFNDVNNSTESDFYAGYNGKVGEVGYTVGGTYYVYTPGYHSATAETKLGVSYGPVAISAQTILNDVTWSNKGDTYWTAVYTHALPQDFTATANLGWYTYKKDGEFIKGSELCASGASCKAVGNAFRHLIVGVTKPFGKTGATWGMSYIIAGKNRFDQKQDNQLIGSLTYAF